MILDSSAILAIFFKEPDYQLLLRKLSGAPWVAIGAPTLTETAILLAARFALTHADWDSRALLLRFLHETHIAVIAFTDDHFALAHAAWLQYGKGRHPAALNLGDCLAYAIAKHAGMSLLCTGDHFAQTDLPLA